MQDFNGHPAFAWLAKQALDLPVYAEYFDGAAITTMGESPYLDAKRAGIELVLNADHSVRAVHLYSEGVEGFSAYQGALPAGLTLANNRADVRAALGDPAMTTDAGGTGLMAIAFSFDRFEAAGRYVRFEYLRGNAAIRMITFGICSD